MQLYELVFTVLAIYLLYKLIFNVVVPVAKVSSQMRDRMKNMQQNEPVQQPRNNSSGKAAAKNNTTSSNSDYIDFEEIK